MTEGVSPGQVAAPLVGSAAARPVAAAGTLPWRLHGGSLEVLLVHRPAYDDWAWAKGKLDPGEEWPTCAARETWEETGLQVRLGRPLPPASYTFLDKAGELATKEVRYWAAEVTGGDGALVNEIDEVAWLPVAEASDRLHYARDRDQLRALVRASTAGRLATWPLVLVRHAHAVSRSAWAEPDPLRPLDAAGEGRAETLVGLLGAYGITRLVTSPSVRSAATLAPYAAARGLKLRAKPVLSEEMYAVTPDRAMRPLERLLERGQPAALCSHGPVLPSLLGRLARTLDTEEDEGGAGAAALEEAADLGMAKGEALVCHIAGTGAVAQLVAVERHLP